jgi:hypothetical protein
MKEWSAKGMSDQRIKVIAYSGYRGEETPTTIILHDERIEVVEIQDMWIEESVEDRARKRFFEIKGNNGNTYKIYYDEKVMEWLYVVEE